MKLQKSRRPHFVFAIVTAVVAAAFMFVAGPVMASPDDYLTEAQKTELSGFLGNLGSTEAGAVLANDDAYELLEKLNAADSTEYDSIIQHFLEDEVYDYDDDDDDDDDDYDDDDDDDYDDDDDDDDEDGDDGDDS